MGEEEQQERVEEMVPVTMECGVGQLSAVEVRMYLLADTLNGEL